MPAALPLIIALPVLLLFSAIASGSETALFSLTHRDRARLRETHHTAWAAVESLLKNRRRLLLFVLLLNMVANVSYFVVAAVLTTHADNPLHAAAISAGTVLAIVLFGEILAKIIAGAGRMKFCILLAPPLATIGALLAPVVAALDRFVLAPMIRLTRPHHPHQHNSVDPEELDRLIDSGGRAGVLTDSETRLLGEVIELGQIRVREAMQPRDRIVRLPVSAPPQTIIETAAANSRTIILLVEDDLDTPPVGFLHVKRYIAARHAAEGARQPEPDPRGFVEPPLYIPEHTRLDLALVQLKGRGRALCVDERGVIVGLLEISDIIDELLSGLSDERSAERHSIQLIGLGVWSVPARLAARDWAEFFGIDEQDFDPDLAKASTIGGVVIDRLGRMPAVGDAVTIGPVRLRVDTMRGRQIDRLRVELVDAPMQDTQQDNNA